MEAGGLPSFADFTRLLKDLHHGIPPQTTFDSLPPPLARPHTIMASSSKPNADLNSSRPLFGGHAEQSRHHVPHYGGREARATCPEPCPRLPFSHLGGYPLTPHPNSVQPRQVPQGQMPSQNGLLPPGPEFCNAPWPQTHAEPAPVASTQYEAILGLVLMSNKVSNFTTVLQREFQKHLGHQPTRIPSEDEFNQAVMVAENLKSTLEQFRDWCKDNTVPHNPAHEVKEHRGLVAPPGWCHECGRIDTPEWRRGPDGAGTLCNACGLH